MVRNLYFILEAEILQACCQTLQFFQEAGTQVLKRTWEVSGRLATLHTIEISA